MNGLFEFDLPKELIAQEPARPRDHARLLVYSRQNGLIADDYFYNLPKHLAPQTTVVANNTRVNHCRYLFDNAKTEIFVVEALNDRTVRAIVRPGRAFKLGALLDLGTGLSVQVEAIDEDGLRTLSFNCPRDDGRLVRASHVPLPPYIKQNDDLAGEYQTVYAQKYGSLAAPTAGLHFTPELQRKVKTDFGWEEVTLDVGLGTFAPLTDQNFKTKTLHSETYHVPKASYERIMDAPHITAVGTTSLRTIETVADTEHPLSGSTSIFITPGHTFKRVDALITNFHLPSTSLLLLVEAFIDSRADIERVYAHAIRERYRFYSFGDAMLIQ
jgi:S-adenosylmethionine:tRNA ribosyltransferase-isomerase